MCTRDRHVPSDTCPLTDTGTDTIIAIAFSLDMTRYTVRQWQGVLLGHNNAICGSGGNYNKYSRIYTVTLLVYCKHGTFYTFLIGFAPFSPNPLPEHFKMRHWCRQTWVAS